MELEAREEETMARTEPTIANYDARTANEITQRLRNLSQTDLAKLETYERRGQNRSTVPQERDRVREAQAGGVTSRRPVGPLCWRS